MSALLKLINHEVQHSCSAPGIDLQILRLNVSMNLRRELCILDDISCNLLREASTHNSSYLTNIFDSYGLSHLITEPTCVIPVAKTLIDLCPTNSTEKGTNSGVIHLGISDHSLMFMTPQIHHDRNCPRTIKMRQFKHFKKN